MTTEERTEALSRAIEALPEIAQEMVCRWRGRIEMAGRVGAHGSALRSLEEFVASIMAIVGSTQGEVENLQGIVRSLADRVATQSELLARVAEQMMNHAPTSAVRCNHTDQKGGGVLSSQSYGRKQASALPL